ncbi:adenylate cyclase associated N terminal-domain-containing protein [Crassisporium funariophilum]|nr:adenylate cyclase associated N terminal-domain-containing protein [Crassisporium funariophilum]
MNSGGLHSLATLIKRLEAAALRFEDIADLPLALDPSANLNRGNSAARSSYQAPAPAPTTPAAAPTVVALTPTPSAAPLDTPPSILEFKAQILDDKLKAFVEFTKSLAAPSLIEVVSLVQKQYDLLLSFLTLAAACQKPDQKTLEGLLGPLAQSIEAVSRAKESYRRDRDWFSHLTLLGEGGPVVGWVVHPKPVQSIIDIKDSVVYYGNKIKKEYKEKNPKHAEWVNLYMAILDTMQAYVKQYHLTGLAWNPKGMTFDQYKAGSSGPSAGSAPQAPPPPPPPPPAAAAAATPAPGGGPGAVFAQLNRGEEVTKGLRKVDKSEMTHKNPALRASSVVPASPASSPVGKKPLKPTKPQALAGKKPAKFLLDGNKWLIEFQENETLTVEDVSLSQSVNIFGCKGATIIIKGKVNAVNIINSVKTSVLVQSVVSAVSVTASPSFQLQITGSAPMIQLDSTDSGQIYLSKDSLTAEITTAKCSAINISLPVEGEEDGVFEEQAVPEMFRTVVKDGKLVTTIVEHSG